MASQEVVSIIMDFINNTDKGFRDVNRSLGEFKKNVDGVYRDANGKLRDQQGRFVKDFKDNISDLSRALAPVSLAAGAALGGSAKLAIDFEKSLMQASKSLSLTAPQLAEFSAI